MRLIISSLFLLLFASCSINTKEVKPFKAIQDTKKRYYSLKEYKDNNLTNIYHEYLKMLEQPTIDKTKIRKEMPNIKLKTIYNNFNDVIKNENFFNEYPINKLNDDNLNTLVYYKNKAIIQLSGEDIFDATTKCFFINYYLLTIDNNKLKVLFIDSEGGQIVIPKEKQ